jgi:hypothetical protein
MKNTCPKCGTAYAVNASVIGRTFACKNCGSALVVTAAGLDFNSPAPAAPAPAPMPAAAPAPAIPGGAFDFDGPGGGDSDRPGRKKKRARRDEEDEEEEFVPRVAVRQRNTGGGLGAYLAFREFLAPVVIQVVFWLLAVLIVIGGFQRGLEMIDSRVTTIQILGGLVIVIGIPLMILSIRIYCEIILVVFGIYDRLGEINNALRRRD